MLQKLTLCVTLLVLTLISGVVAAQCPGGRCPGQRPGIIIPNRVQYAQPRYSQPVYVQPRMQVYTAPRAMPAAPSVPRQSYAVDNVPGHWAHPGTIESHLATGHGVNPKGMSREQMLTLHDQLHEGSRVVQPVQQYSVPRLSLR